MSASKAVVAVNGLTKSFSFYRKDRGLRGSVKNLLRREKLVKEAVREVSFDIEEGEIVGFLGPNGAGKTTTLKVLSGILHPTDGAATVLGYVPWRRETAFKRSFSIVMGQKNQLWWDLPASESLYLNKTIYEIPDRDYDERVAELSELLDVRDLLNVQVRRLSLGERMKMELIAALIHRPKVLFLDEPTIGLDIVSQRRVRDFLKAYNRQFGTTIMLTSHYLEDIKDLCKRVIVINNGRIVFDGDLRDVNETLGAKKIIKIALGGTVDVRDLESYGIVKEYDGYNATIEIDKSDVKRLSRDILDALPILDLNIGDVPLEEGITLLYRRE